MTWDEVCRIAQKLPAVEIGSYHGYPALRVAGKFLARLGDDHKSIEFKGIGFDEAELLIEARPSCFFVPDAKKGRMINARLATIDKRTLENLLKQRWRHIAPKALAKSVGAEV